MEEIGLQAKIEPLKESSILLKGTFRSLSELAHPRGTCTQATKAEVLSKSLTCGNGACGALSVSNEVKVESGEDALEIVY